MKYDFTSILNRRGMDAIAVDPPIWRYQMAGDQKWCNRAYQSVHRV